MRKFMMMLGSALALAGLFGIEDVKLRIAVCLFGVVIAGMAITNEKRPDLGGSER